MGDWRNLLLDFFVFEEIASTQTWLINQIKTVQDFSLPACVISQKQSDGIGSRGNEWVSVEEALLFSFAFSKKDLPQDLPLQSLSIYIGEMMGEFLEKKGFDVWVKWPNDLYLNENKVGGIITQSIAESCVCGIGINLVCKDYACLNFSMNLTEKRHFIEDFMRFFFTYPTWSEILSNYKLKFYKNYPFSFHYGDKTLSFKDAFLCEDGAIVIDNQKFYSLR